VAGSRSSQTSVAWQVFHGGEVAIQPARDRGCNRYLLHGHPRKFPPSQSVARPPRRPAPRPDTGPAKASTSRSTSAPATGPPQLLPPDGSGWDPQDWSRRQVHKLAVCHRCVKAVLRVLAPLRAAQQRNTRSVLQFSERHDGLRTHSSSKALTANGRGRQISTIRRQLALRSA
jgi:hypothetical protein